jgi:phytoene dehydrogenase-like protein
VANDEGSAPKTGGRIEGGVDAVVIGASVDGLAAAALLGKAGYRTILIGAGGAELDDARREFEPGYFAIDGEHLVTHLDPELAAALDLYRHGLSFANRRLDTVYFFSDGGALLTEGDLYKTRESVVAMAAADASRFADFIELALDTGRALRPFFEGGPMPSMAEPIAAAAEQFLTAAIDDVLESAFADAHLKSLLAAEASLRSAARPGEPFGFSSLLLRWAGEAAGLQAAAAYPEGGAAGVKRALRRAAQAARVDFRPSIGVTRVLVEWDGVAGVETIGGGQVRAPIVINALSAREAFLDLVGPMLLDIEFQSALAAPKPTIAAARLHFAIKGEPDDERTRANLTRRLVYAPSKEELLRGHGAARRGEVASPVIMEALFPSAYDRSLAPAGCHVVSAWLHPVPFRAEEDAELKEKVVDAARDAFKRIAPSLADLVLAVDVRLPADEAKASGMAAELFAASPSVLQGWSRARRLTEASGVAGYFFCGPEAQIGPGISGAAGRRAAREAIRFSKTRAHA